MPLFRPGLAPVPCCCCCACCELPDPGPGSWLHLWSPCVNTFDSSNNPSVPGGEVGYINDVNDPSPGNALNPGTLLSYQVLNPTSLDLLLGAGPGGCPEVEIRTPGAKGTTPALAFADIDIMTPGVLWTAFTAPMPGVAGAGVMTPPGGNPTNLLGIGLSLSGQLILIDGAGSIATPIVGGVEPGDLLLLGFEYDPLTPSYRTWINRIEGPAVGFPAGSTLGPNWSPLVAGQSGFEWLFAGFMENATWEQSIAVMDAWAASALGSRLALLDPLP